MYEVVSFFIDSLSFLKSNQITRSYSDFCKATCSDDIWTDVLTIQDKRMIYPKHNGDFDMFQLFTWSKLQI